jgi:hypothetical protein
MPSSDELLHGNRRNSMWLVNAFSNDRRMFISQPSICLVWATSVPYYHDASSDVKKSSNLLFMSRRGGSGEHHAGVDAAAI